MENEFKTLGELGKMFNCSYSDLYYLIKSKRLASAKNNGVLVAHTDHVRHLMKSKFNNSKTPK
jgi:hypothetical protein